MAKPRTSPTPALADPDWKVRRDAVNALAANTAPELLDHLLPRCQDPNAEVRVAALRAVALYDDGRTLPELLHALWDGEECVRGLARSLLEDGVASVPALAKLRGNTHWQGIVGEAEEALNWGEQLGRDLLGRPVSVHPYRGGVGRTGPSPPGEPVVVDVTLDPVFTVQRHGGELVRGVILHELGHQLYDIGVPGEAASCETARAEGLGEIYDTLLDERLERRLRARDGRWGPMLDRLTAHFFRDQETKVPAEVLAKFIKVAPGEALRRIQAGDLPGRIARAPDGGRVVALTERNLEAIPGLVAPIASFLRALRKGLRPDECRDPNVARAVALVPRKLKDLDHAALLDLAREIGAVIGRSQRHGRDLARMRRIARQLGAGGEDLARLLERMADLLRRHPQEMFDTSSKGRHSQVQRRRERVVRLGLPVGFEANLNPEREFRELENEESLPFDPDAHAALVGPIRKHVRLLRAYFERLSARPVDERASRRGSRIDVAQARTAALTRRLNLFVHSRDELWPDAYVGVLIDRSGSMDGEKIERAKAFGMLVAESLRGLHGISGHVNAFDDSTFYRLGGFRGNAIAGLSADDGNNDAGGLARAAELALASRKRNKLLIMISDGLPTECTFESLKHLVERLVSDHGIVCTQVAVDRIEWIAFPHFVDLTACEFEESVTRFGRMLMRLTASWK